MEMLCFSVVITLYRKEGFILAISLHHQVGGKGLYGEGCGSLHKGVLH